MPHRVGRRPRHTFYVGTVEVPRFLGRDGVRLAYRRALTALLDGSSLDPDSTEEQISHWAGRLEADPQAVLHVLDSLIPTPGTELRQITTSTLVVIGGRDERADADQPGRSTPRGTLRQRARRDERFRVVRDLFRLFNAPAGGSTRA